MIDKLCIEFMDPKRSSVSLTFGLSGLGRCTGL